MRASKSLLHSLVQQQVGVSKLCTKTVCSLYQSCDCCAGTLSTTWDNTGDTGPNSGNSSSLLPFYTSGTNALFSTINGAYQPVINMDVSLYVFVPCVALPLLPPPPFPLPPACSSCCEGAVDPSCMMSGFHMLACALTCVALDARDQSSCIQGQTSSAQWLMCDITANCRPIVGLVRILQEAVVYF